MVTLLWRVNAQWRRARGRCESARGWGRGRQFQLGICHDGMHNSFNHMRVSHVHVTIGCREEGSR